MTEGDTTTITVEAAMATIMMDVAVGMEIVDPTMMVTATTRLVTRTTRTTMALITETFLDGEILTVRGT